MVAKWWNIPPKSWTFLLEVVKKYIIHFLFKSTISHPWVLFWNVSPKKKRAEIFPDKRHQLERIHGDRHSHLLIYRSQKLIHRTWEWQSPFRSFHSRCTSLFSNESFPSKFPRKITGVFSNRKALRGSPIIIIIIIMILPGDHLTVGKTENGKRARRCWIRIRDAVPLSGLGRSLGWVGSSRGWRTHRRRSCHGGTEAFRLRGSWEGTSPGDMALEMG